MQKRIQTAAQELDFRVTVEKQLPSGGSVDLVLERGDLTLACEITVTTTIDHEVGNVSKCLAAGFKRVIIVGIDQAKLERLANAVRASLGAESAAHVEYFLPDSFLATLPSLCISPRQASVTRTIRGYRVKTTTTQVPTHEAHARETALLQTLAAAMKKA